MKRLLAFSSVVVGLSSLSVPEPVSAQQCIRVPVPCVVTSAFGPRYNPITKGYSTEFHRGIDFGCPMHTPVSAADTGIVDVSGFSNSAGNWVRTQRSGMTFKYMHNARNAAFAGNMVSPGQLIAYTGNTGRSTGPHLHFQVERGGQAIDPMSMFCTRPQIRQGILDGGLPAQSDTTSLETQATPPGNFGTPPMGIEGSLNELLSDAIGSRSLNPDYARQLQGMDELGLYREISYQGGLRLRAKAEMQRSTERRLAIAAMVNVLMADSILRPQLEAQRSAGASAARPQRQP